MPQRFSSISFPAICGIFALAACLACSDDRPLSDGERLDRIARTVLREMGSKGNEDSLRERPVPPGERIEVLSAGEEPRQPLRYDWPTAGISRVELVVDSLFSAQMADRRPEVVDGPPIRMRLAVGPRQESDGPEVSLPFRVAESAVEACGDLDAVTRQSLEAEAGAVRGLGGRLLLTERGRLKRVDLDLTGDADPRVERAAAKLVVQLRQLITRFPDEPLGVGARWWFSRHFNSHRFRYGQLSECRLDDRRGRQVKLFCRTIRTAPTQPAGRPGLFNSRDVKLVEYRADGMYTGWLDLTRLIPALYLVDQNRLTMRMEVSGDSREFSSTIQTGLRTRPL